LQQLSLMYEGRREPFAKLHDVKNTVKCRRNVVDADAETIRKYVSRKGV